MEINYLDLFSGIGGFHEGLRQAGFKFGWTGHSEVDKYANEIYKKHFPFSEGLGDVRTITIDKLPRRINLITFGFPCQDLSIAGKRGGLQADRSILFFEAMRIIGDAKPDYFIFENVKGLFSSNRGLDWFNVLREVADIGYDGQWQLLNTRWVLPQNRERIYFVGYPRNKPRPEVFPLGKGIDIFSKKNEGQQREGARISSTIDSRYGSLRNVGETYLMKVGVINKDAQGQRIYDTNGISCQLTAQGGGWGAKTGLYEINQGIRRLTPLECERLQGFPDCWTEGISDTQRYKCLGNAVTVPIVKMIGERLLNAIKQTGR